MEKLDFNMTDSELSMKLMYLDEEFFIDVDYDNLLRCAKINPTAIWYMQKDDVDSLMIAYSLVSNHNLFDYTFKLFNDIDYSEVFKNIYTIGGMDFFILERQELKLKDMYKIAMDAIDETFELEISERYKEYCIKHELQHTPSLFIMFRDLILEKEEILDKVREISDYYTYNLRKYIDDDCVVSSKAYQDADSLCTDYLNIAKEIIETYAVKREF